MKNLVLLMVAIMAMVFSSCNNNLQEENKQLMSQVSLLKRDTSSYRTIISSLRNQLNQKKKDLVDLRRKNDFLENQIQTLEKSLGEKDKTIEALRASINSLREQIILKDQRITLLGSQLSALQIKKEELQKSLTLEKKNYEDLRMKYDEVKNKKNWVWISIIGLIGFVVMLSIVVGYFKHISTDRSNKTYYDNRSYGDINSPHSATTTRTDNNVKIGELQSGGTRTNNNLSLPS